MDLCNLSRLAFHLNGPLDYEIFVIQEVDL